MNATRIAESLTPYLVRSGRNYIVPCVAHQDNNPSLSLSNGADGKLLVKCFAGCDGVDILRALQRKGLLEDNGPAGYVAAEISHNEITAQQERRKDYALRIWQQTLSAEGSVAESYLRYRGFTGNIPPSLRYHPRLKHAPSGTFHPALVGGVMIAPHNDVQAIWRIYLQPDGAGKAAVEPAKMGLGLSKGGAVRLAAASDTIIITEGIETGLSVLQATGIPTWAALSATGMENLIPPPLPLAAEIIIAADNDANDRGMQAAQKAAARWTLEGRKVRIAMPPSVGTDFNDLFWEAAK